MLCHLFILVPLLLADCCKVHFLHLYLKKLSKIAQNDKHKISFLHQQRDSHKVICQKLGISHHGVLLVLKNVRKPDKWRRKE